jgi:hypothetical protein
MRYEADSNFSKQPNKLVRSPGSCVAAEPKKREALMNLDSLSIPMYVPNSVQASYHGYHLYSQDRIVKRVILENTSHPQTAGKKCDAA